MHRFGAVGTTLQKGLDAQRLDANGDLRRHSPHQAAIVHVCYKPREECEHSLRVEDTPVQGVSLQQRTSTVYQHRRQRDIHPSRGLPLVPILRHTGVERRTHAWRNPVVFDVQPLYQQTVSKVGLFFPDLFKESSRVALSSKEARQVQRTLAVTAYRSPRRL
jgi:hypothetical protein